MIDTKQVRPIVACDAGNRYIKWVSPANQVKSLLSSVKELDKYDSYDVQANCTHTACIELNDGKRYLIGRDAAQTGGQMVFDGNKCELAQVLVLAALQPNCGETDLVVNELRLCLPDSRVDKNREALQRLAGTHTFYRNGTLINAEVKSVRAVDETMGSFRKAKREGMFSYAGALNGVISLGGKDGIARLYTADGQVNRNADVKIDGTLRLVTFINKALAVEMGRTVESYIIMDAIERGDYTIQSNGFNFSKLFFEAREKWWKGIRDAIAKQWQPFIDEIGEILVVGGSAHVVAKHLPNKRYKVPTDPQHFDLLGLL